MESVVRILVSRKIEFHYCFNYLMLLLPQCYCYPQMSLEIHNKFRVIAASLSWDTEESFPDII